MKSVGGGNGAPFWKPLIGLPDVTGINRCYGTRVLLQLIIGLNYMFRPLSGNVVRQ